MSEERLPKEEERKFRERSLVVSIERQIESARRSEFLSLLRKSQASL